MWLVNEWRALNVNRYLPSCGLAMRRGCKRPHAVSKMLQEACLEDVCLALVHVLEVFAKWPFGIGGVVGKHEDTPFSP